MIAVIDLQIGNIGSVARALKFLKCQFRVTAQVQDIENASKLIFPGVGSFAEASKKLGASGLREVIVDQVLGENKPILGICLGMQLFAKDGEEGGLHEGLGLIDASVHHMGSKSFGLRLPHMGWNDLSGFDLKLLRGVQSGSCFYFVHSYEMKLNENIAHVTTDYGAPVVAMIEKGNIFATQFHPEKSQEQGLKILQNFNEI